MYEQLLTQLQFEEGRRNEAYMCPAGHRTIGIGHNLDVLPEYHGSPIPDRLSDAEIDAIFTDDVYRAANTLTSTWKPFGRLSPARRDALVNMAFQMGAAGVLRFVQMLAFLERGMWSEAAKAALNSEWAKQTPERARRVAHQLQTGEYYAVPE